MLATLAARDLTTLGSPTHTQVFDETLAKSNDTGKSDDQGNDVIIRATLAGGFGRAGDVRGKEHAEGNNQVREDSRIACQSICQQNIPEFAILCFRQTSKTDALQGHEEPISARARDPVEGQDENKQSYEEI